MAVYTAVFSLILKVEVGAASGKRSFGVFLIAGIIPWLAIQDAIVRSVNVLEENASLLKQNAFPMALLPAQMVLGALANQIIITAIFMAVAWHWLDVSLPMLFLLPALLLWQAALMAGICFAVSALNPLLKDIGQVILVLLQVWFFSAPIVYPRALVPPGLATLVDVNPLTQIVGCYRSILLSEPLPTLNLFVLSTLPVVAVALVGVKFFERARDGIVDVL